MNCFNTSYVKSNGIFDIANALPKVNNGPKVKKTTASPSPFLEDNLRGLAV